MKIRLMTIDDYDGAIKLWHNTPGMGLNDADDSREGIEKYLARNPSTCFVAVDGGAVVGTIMSGHDGRRGFIIHTAVAQSHQRQGVGKALANAAVAALSAEGITKAALVAYSANAIGNDFWEKQGFLARTDLTYRDKIIGGYDK